VKILFIFHEARLTGATLALYRIVFWLKHNTNISMSFILLEKGDLYENLTKLGLVVDWPNYNTSSLSFKKKIVQKVFKKYNQNKILRQLRKENFDIIYFNTIVSSSIAKVFTDFKAKKVWHVHEIELATKTIGENYLNAHYLFDIIIANSKSTESYLQSIKIESSKIHVFYPVINRFEITNQSKVAISKSFEDNIKNSFVIGSSGTAIERKGIQAFLITSKIIQEIYPNNNFKFVWVGSIDNQEKIMVEYDIERAGLKDKVYFLGLKNNPYPYYLKFDVFVSTSKEESFGLSLMEAAFLKKPVICFDNTGALCELVKNAENIVVPYLDVNKLAIEIIKLSNNPIILEDLAKKAGMSAQKYDENTIMPALLSFLKSII
jgi:glycosyltransferase involved in cell wall biosynthesis